MDKTNAIESEWTVYVCPLCGYMPPDQYTHAEGDEPFCVFGSRGLSRGGVKLHPYSREEGWDPEARTQPIQVVRKAQQEVGNA